MRHPRLLVLFGTTAVAAIMGLGPQARADNWYGRVVVSQPAPVATCTPAPVYQQTYYQPAPAAYVPRPPVVYQPAPVVYQPAPVIVAPPPAYCPPPPPPPQAYYPHRHHGGWFFGFRF